MPVVKFTLKDSNAQKQSLVNLSFNFEGKRLRCSAGISVPPKHWIYKDKEGRVVNCLNHRGFTEFSRVNNHLARVKKIVESFYLSQKEKGIIPDPQTIKEHLHTKINQPENQSPDEFYKVYEKFLEVQHEFLEPRSIQNYRTILNSIKEFEATKGFKISFKNFDLNFAERYQIFLMQKENLRFKGRKLVRKDNTKNTYIIVNEDDPRHGETVGLFNDTVAKNLSTLKGVLKWAYERDYTPYNKFSNVRTYRKDTKEIVTLTEAELKQLALLDLDSNSRLEKVRDLFIFGLFTGQRWSDISSFKIEDLKADTWSFIAEKTKKQTTIPLSGFSKPALQVLIKYNYQLPRFSAQKFNVYLKQVGKLAEIEKPVVIKRYIGKKEIEIKKAKWEFMSSHMARRTCITLLLEKGVPITTILKLTQHSNVRTLMKYENTSIEALKNELERVGNLVEPLSLIYS